MKKSALNRYDTHAIESSVLAWRYFQAASHLMDNDLREQVHQELAPCSEREFLTRYCELHMAKFNEVFECE